MNLLCPNCQKPLTVPEQYAGQPMRCPLCAGTFTVPALPQTAVPPPPPPPPPAPSPTYGLKDPVAPPPPSPNLSFETSPAPKPPSSFTGAPPPSGPPPAHIDGQPTFPSTPTPEGYQRKYTIWFSPKALQYVAPVALFLVLVLTFFAWTGVYPGGVAVAWQNAWQATYGGVSTDADAASKVPPFPDKNAEPGWSPLLIFYLLLFIPTFLITVGCLALAFVPPAQLAPLQAILPWRWGIVAALNLVLFLFLALQLVLGFSLENNVIAAADKAVAVGAESRKEPATTPEQREDAIERGRARQEVSRTVWLDLVVLFHLLAIAGAGLMFCLNRRGARPAPRIDALW